MLAWSLGAFESRNLWDHLLDPLVFAWGFFPLLLRSAKGLGAGLISARRTTIKLPSVAVTTDDHLAMAAGAVQL